MDSPEQTMTSRRAAPVTTLRASELTVAQVMTPEMLSCESSTPITEAARRMSQERRSSIIVMNQQAVVGIWTERDALRHDLSRDEVFDVPVSQVMSAPVATIEVSASLGEAALRFQEEKVRHYLVVNEAGDPCGMISQTDVVLNHGVEWCMRMHSAGSAVRSKPLLGTPDMTLADAAQAMNGNRADSIVIRDRDGTLGILTQRDIVRCIAERSGAAMAVDVASKPLVTVHENNTLFHARNIMFERRFRHIGVTGNAGELVGLIGFADILTTIEHGYIEELEHALNERDASLRASEQRFRTYAETASDWFWEIDVNGRLTTVSERIEDILGQSASSLIGHSYRELGGDSEQWDRLEREITNHRPLRDFEVACHSQAGEMRWLLISGRPMFDEDGKYVGYHGTGRDNTRWKQAEAAMRESEQRYRALVEQSPDAIIVHREQRIAFANAAAVRMFGAEAVDALIDLELMTLFAPDSAHAPEDRLRDVGQSGADSLVEERMVRIDGRVIAVEIAAMEVAYGGTPASQLVIRDVTRRKQLEDELRRLATTDQLTGAYNRLHFESHLEQAMKEAVRYETPLGVMMFDIDHFKRVNDHFGHDAGDRVLGRVVEIVSSVLRDADILARWGGEEFMIMAPGTDLEGMGEMAAKIGHVVRQARFEGPPSLTLSFGVAQYRAGEQREHLLKRLDEALYEAKRDGRDRVSIVM
jgi:diguanylate cyclase (GGDEF)-like protein/PAS domain S-box-containing protein